MTELLLGVDGGATKTIALIADDTGTIKGAGRAGSSDIHSEIRPGAAVENVVAAVERAAVEGGIDTRHLTSAAFGLCGADWPEDVDYYHAALQDRLALSKEPLVINDAFNSLRAGTTDGVGVALVLGTGGAVAARGPDGRTWFSGERMERAGALELGGQAFDLIVRGEYGGGQQPSFVAAALAVFGSRDVDEMVYLITRSGGLGRRSLALLAPVVLAAGHAGDPDAIRIIRQQAGVLAGYVQRAAGRVGFEHASAAIVLAGGVLRHEDHELRDAITVALPGHRVTVAPVEPAFGALLMAGDQAGTRMDLDRLVGSGPDVDYFATRVIESGMPTSA